MQSIVESSHKRRSDAVFSLASLPLKEEEGEEEEDVEGDDKDKIVANEASDRDGMGESSPRRGSINSHKP